MSETGGKLTMVEIIEKLFTDEDVEAALAYLDHADNGLKPEDCDRLDKMFRQHPQMSKDERVDAICNAGKGAARILDAGRKYVAAETEEQRELKLGTLNFRISQQAKANAFRS